MSNGGWIPDEPHIHDLLITKSPNYRIIQLLGQGAFGKVYLAEDLSNKKLVAVKTVRDFHNLDEAVLLKRCKHPNIVRLQDSFVENEGRSFTMVMEYCPRTLDYYQRELRQRPRVARRMAYQLLKALNHCHEQGVLHLDVKPANILLKQGRGRSVVLKLGDFGAATRIHAEGVYRDIGQGTPYYKAPEMMLGSSEYGPAADVWSAACVIFELITGQKKLFDIGCSFEESNLGDIFRRMTELCGQPSWHGVQYCRMYRCLLKDGHCHPGNAENLKIYLSEKIKDKTAVDLLSKMLAINPHERICIKDALQHAYFQNQ